MLQDMIVLAFNDAFKKVDDDKAKALGPYANQLGGLF
jgi:DNA-binding protein YbaB